MAAILHRFFHVSRFLIACAVLFPTKLFAQQDTSKKLKQVDVSSSAIPVRQGVTPSQSLSSNDFERYNALTVADAIRDFAGVNLKDYGGIGGLKTVSVRGFGADHTAILYDGIQMNDAENGQIDLSKLNLTGVARITLYNAQPDDILNSARAFASASVISIQTIQPNLTAAKPYQVIVGINGGSFGLVNPYLQWQQRISGRWSFAVNGYSESANGRYPYKVPAEGNDSTHIRNNADVNDQRIDGAVYWFKNDSNKFDLHINYYYANRGLPGAVILYNPISNQRLLNKDYFTQSSLEQTWGKHWKFLLNRKLSNEHTHYTDPDYLNNDGGLDEHFAEHEIYQSAAISYRIAPNWDVSVATDIAIASVHVTSPNNSVYKYASPKRFTLQDVLASKLGLGRWIFEGDVLHSYLDEWTKMGPATPNKTDFSPTLMASFLPTASHDIILRAFYKNIFREPTLDEQYLLSVTGSRDLKPEYTKQYDIGVAYRKVFDSFLDYIALNIDGYYNTVSNKIVAIPNQNEEISTIINIGHVLIEGTTVDLKLETKKNNDWQGVLSADYTYQYAVDNDPAEDYYHDQIPYTPKNTFSMNTGVNYNQMGLYFNQVLSSSRYFLEQSSYQNFIEGYGVSDLSLIYKLRLDHYPVMLSGHVDNLFNQGYEIVRSFPMPGRSYLLSFQIII